jgi:hypothetical protein
MLETYLQMFSKLRTDKGREAERDILDLLTFSGCPGQQRTKPDERWIPDYPFA